MARANPSRGGNGEGTESGFSQLIGCRRALLVVSPWADGGSEEKFRRQRLVCFSLMLVVEGITGGNASAVTVIAGACRQVVTVCTGKRPQATILASTDDCKRVASIYNCSTEHTTIRRHQVRAGGKMATR